MGKKRNLASKAIDVANDFVSLLPDTDLQFIALKTFVVALKTAVAVDYVLYPDETEEIYKGVGSIVKANPSIANTPEFYQSLLITHEVHGRTRNAQKREYIRRVYLEGYLRADDLHAFELERMYDVAQKISVPALQFLKFFDEKIKQTKIDRIRKEVAHLSDPEPHYNVQYKMQADSNYIQEWIHNEYGPSGSVVKSQHPDAENNVELIEKYGKIEREHGEKMAEIYWELVSLGVMRSSTALGGNVYSFTSFGEEFKTFTKSLALERDLF
jgi:hypothetical protein